jgi:hypothetical protein
VIYLFYPEIFTRNFYYRHFYPIYEQKSFFYGHFYLFYGQKSARYEHLPIKWKTNKLFKRNKEAIFSKITPLGNPFTKNKKLHFLLLPLPDKPIIIEFVLAKNAVSCYRGFCGGNKSTLIINLLYIRTLLTFFVYD